ncbi:MAG TPA: N-methyl-L-tryptophan oxidase [Candidatus Limnocylindrales bacterium]|nr:N-methyl-L-tryptophan oxidase [Candidatus Limnocylindrales bacterium]
MAQPAYDAIVAGVGGMGSATAWALARRGARVLGLERAGIPNALGSSHGVNRIIRLAYAEDPRYVPLLRRSYELWRETEHLSGERLLYVTGGIDAGPPDGPTVAGALTSAREHAIAYELLDAAALRERFPAFDLPAGYQAVHQADAGFVLSERAIAVFAGLAMGAGAELHGHEPVEAWEPEPGGLAVHTARATYRARRLIITAGAWIGRLVPAWARLAVPERQVLIWAQPRDPAVCALGRLPVFIIEVPEGRFYGFPPFGVPGVKVGLYHHRGEPVDPETWDRARLEPEDEQVLRAGIERYLPAAAGPTLSLQTCMFTNSPDEHFLLGRLPGEANVVAAGGFSGHGYKFTPVVGEILAQLALDGRTGQAIELFRPDRFD